MKRWNVEKQIDRNEQLLNKHNNGFVIGLLFKSSFNMDDTLKYFK